MARRTALAMTQYPEWSSARTRSSPPPIDQKGAGGHVQLPQLHRHLGAPTAHSPAACGAATSARSAGCESHPVHRGPGHRAQAATAHLEHQPLRAPFPVCPAQLADRRLQLSRDLPRMGMHFMAPVSQAGRPLIPESRSQVWTLWQLTPYRSATSVTGTPATTSSTARYLCSDTLNSHSMSRSVKHQTEPMWARSGSVRTGAAG